MKIIRFLLPAAGLLLAAASPGKAQFLKKLKKTVNAAVSSVTEDDNSGGSGITDASAVSGARDEHSEIKYTDIHAFAPQPVYTLQPGETLDFTESCLEVSTDGMSPRLGIKKGDTYYLVANGQKTKMPADFLRCEYLFGDKDYVSLDVTPHNNHYITEEEWVKPYIQGTMTQMYIKFNNRSYGPFFNVIDFKLDKDHTQFAALALKINMDKADSVESNDPKTLQDFNNLYQAYTLVFLQAGKKPVTVAHTMEGKIVAPDNLSPIRVLYLDHTDFNNPRTLVFNPDNGVTITPPHPGALIFEPAGDFLYIDEENNSFYRNGELIKTFPHDRYSYGINYNNIFIDPDAPGKWAVNSGSDLVFSDGRVAGTAISPRIQYKNGTYGIYWLTLAPDNKTIVLCHAAM